MTIVKKIEDDDQIDKIPSYKPPLKHESHFIKFYRNQNPCHDQDNEKASSVIKNLVRENLQKNPFYNKTLINTEHGKYIDQETLYKLGQITLEEFKRNTKEQWIKDRSQEVQSTELTSGLNSIFRQTPVNHAKTRSLDKDFTIGRNHIKLIAMGGSGEEDQSKNKIQNIKTVKDKFKEGQKEQQQYYFKRLRPWQIYLGRKKKQLQKEEIKYESIEEMEEKAKTNIYLQKLLEIRTRQDFSFLENPVDRCMLKLLFNTEDKLMKFYESKFRFTLRDMRPFAQYTQIKEQNPLYNDEVYNREIKKVFDQEKQERKERAHKYKKMYKNLDGSSFMKPLQRTVNHFETSRNSAFTSTGYKINNEPWQTQNQPEKRSKSYYATRAGSVAINADIRNYTYSEAFPKQHNSLQIDTTFESQKIPQSTRLQNYSVRQPRQQSLSPVSQGDIAELQSQIDEYEKTKGSARHAIKQAERFVSPKIYNKTLDPYLNVNFKTLQQAFGEIDVENIDEKVSQKMNKHIYETSRNWHLNDIKSLNTATQLKDLRTNRFNKIRAVKLKS